jgi:hypothetical protein
MGSVTRRRLGKMKNPQVGQRVWSNTLIGTFTVTAVYPDQALVDLQLASDPHIVEERVPLGQIHPVGGDHSPTSRD